MVTAPPKYFSPLITLIGLPGAGKSTVGKLLAQRHQAHFRDIDQILRVKNHWQTQLRRCPAAGVNAFRRQETEVLQALIQFVHVSEQNKLGTRYVLATGGGIIEAEANRALLAQQTYAIYLKAPLTLVQTRWKLPASGPPRLETNPARLQARLSWYAAVAQLTITVDADVTPLQLQEKISAQLRREGFFYPDKD